jgi:bacterioferritin
VEPGQEEVGGLDTNGCVHVERVRARRGWAGPTRQREQACIVVAAQPIGSGFGRAVQYRHAHFTRATTQVGDPLEYTAGGNRGGERRDPAALPHHVLLHFHGDQRGVFGIDEGGKIERGDRANVTDGRVRPNRGVEFRFSGNRNGVDTENFVRLLNEDLESEFQSIVQYVQHIAVVTGAEYMNTVAELRTHLTQELQHATTLAEQVNFLGGAPSTDVPPIARADETTAALEADLDLEAHQLERYRERVQQATDMGLVDVAEALRPLLTQTQEHVRDLNAALGN